MNALKAHKRYILRLEQEEAKKKHEEFLKLSPEEQEKSRKETEENIAKMMGPIMAIDSMIDHKYTN